MSTSSDPSSLAPFLPDVYRFAYLMSGDGSAAAAVLRRTVERAARAGIVDLRDARRVKRWLFTEARQQCTSPAARSGDTVVPETTNDVEPPGPAQLAARFAHLPEAERSALILFYLYLFDPGDLAEVLEIPSADLAPLLGRGREQLGGTP